MDTFFPFPIWCTFFAMLLGLKIGIKIVSNFVILKLYFLNFLFFIFVLIKILFFVRITGLIRSKSEKSMHLFFKFVISVRKIKNNLGLLIINDHNFVEIKKGHSFHETVYK